MWVRMNSDQSDWSQYIMLLPTQTPLYKLSQTNWCWSTFIAPTFLAAPIAAKRKSVADEFEWLKSIEPVMNLFEALNATVSDYEWASSCYLTRVMDIPTSSGNLKAVVPIIDFCNHSATPNAFWEFDASQPPSIILKANADGIAEGEEVCISYGTQITNAELLFLHGFASPDTSIVSSRLPLPFMELAGVSSDSLPGGYWLKKDLIDRFGLPRSVFLMHHKSSQSLSNESNPLANFISDQVFLSLIVCVLVPGTELDIVDGGIAYRLANDVFPASRNAFEHVLSTSPLKHELHLRVFETLLGVVSAKLNTMPHHTTTSKPDQLVDSLVIFYKEQIALFQDLHTELTNIIK